MSGQNVDEGSKALDLREEERDLGRGKRGEGRERWGRETAEKETEVDAKGEEKRKKIGFGEIGEGRGNKEGEGDGKKKGKRLFAGIDFGTSNSSFAVAGGDEVRLVSLDGGRSMPSSVFVLLEDKSGKLVFGRQAFALAHGVYEGEEGSVVQGERTGGRLFRCLKSLLGSSTLDEQVRLADASGYNHCYYFYDLIAEMIRFMKGQAEDQAGGEVEGAVLGRPVRFVDGDDVRDALAQAQLEKIAKRVGFKEVAFLFEPIAAALAYEATLQEEELAAVIDVGGGTTDVSIVRLGPSHAAKADRNRDILSSAGVHLGGTDFDYAIAMEKMAPSFGFKALDGLGRFLPLETYYNFARWSTLNRLYTRKTSREISNFLETAAEDEARRVKRLERIVDFQEAHLAMRAVERAKIALSEDDKSRFDWDDVLPKEDALDIFMARGEMIDEILGEMISRMRKTVLTALQEAGVRAEEIGALFLTGGPAAMPDLRKKIAVDLFPSARLVQGDRFGAVGFGLGLRAQRLFGGR